MPAESPSATDASAQPAQRYCQQCGYDLRASAGRCPECGRAFDPADPRTFRATPPSPVPRWLRRIALLLVILLALPAGGLLWLWLGWRAEQPHIAAIQSGQSNTVKVEMHYAWAKRFLPMRLMYLADRATSVRVISRQGDASDMDHVAALPHIRTLYLSDSVSTSTELAKVGELRELEDLVVSSNRADEAFARRLSALPRLQSLRLISESIGDDAVADWAGLKSLEELSLMYSRVSDAGVKSLSRLPRLRSLDLTGAPITDAAVDDLLKIQTLRKLNVTRTGITPAGGSRLRAGVSGAAIYESVLWNRSPSQIAAEQRAAEAERAVFMSARVRIDAFRNGPLDLKALEGVADETYAQWSKRDAPPCAHLMIAVAQVLMNSTCIDDPVQYDLLRKSALRALEKPDVLSLDVEREAMQALLVPHAPWGTARERADERTVNMAHWFHLYKRLKDSIDPAWDPNDRPGRLPPVPPGLGSINGAPTGGIADPKVLADYRAAFAARQEKNRRYAEQALARRVQQEWCGSDATAEQFIIRAYSALPAGTDELKSCLDKYVPDPAMRQRILDQVQANLANARPGENEGLSKEEFLRRRSQEQARSGTAIEESPRLRRTRGDDQPATHPAQELQPASHGVTVQDIENEMRRRRAAERSRSATRPTAP